MKMPKLPKIAFPRRQKKLQVSTVAPRRAAPADNYYGEEPKTNLSSAFVVVLILHVVAVGGIYAFNSIKAARAPIPPVATTTPSVPPALAKTVPVAPPPLPAVAAPATGPTQVASLFSPISKNRVHQVKSGDNLTRIAGQYNVTVADLEEANGIKNANELRVGQTLTIPVAKPATKATPIVAPDPRKAAFLAAAANATPEVTATSKGGSKTYTVVKGDTATSIAQRFGTTPTALLKLNKIDDPKKMQLGQTLILPPKKSN